MEPRNINVLLTSFGGLGLSRTHNLVCPETIQLNDLLKRVEETLPPLATRLVITTASNKLLKADKTPLSTLLADEASNLLQLRLTVPLCGGKGGFGSQLRAAGGRMSSKRKKNQGDNNGSNRNLDGRRLRTVNEAKALAEYLALKPEMEKKEKEERRKRWQQVIDLAEKREEELRSGSKGKVDEKWVEDKEEAGERTREAVLAAMKSDSYRDNLNDASARQASVSRLKGRETKGKGKATPAIPSTSPKPVETSSLSYAGFDEDDEFMSDSAEETGSHIDDEGGAIPGVSLGVRTYTSS